MARSLLTGPLTSRTAHSGPSVTLVRTVSRQGQDGDVRWRLLVPVKAPALAKTRLDLPAAHRRALTLAMAADVLAVAMSLTDVDVAVIGGDSSLESLGVPVWPGAGGGLSAAVRVATELITDPVAVLAGDLPCVTVEELGAALEAAAGVAMAMVPDTPGTGTTLLTARRGDLLHPSYGEGSRDRHVAAGATDLGSALALTGLRRDVDTLDDLAEAIGLGIGPASRLAVSAAGLTAVHLPAT